ncbi:MAG: hypothetical protein JSR82_11310 [Verrucomicrobia bacterium]|nr:hypothetical protein [Verrucomicrobiota bacterium]
MIWRAGVSLAVIGAVGILAAILAVAFGDGVPQQSPVPWRDSEPDFGLSEWRARQPWCSDEVEEYRRSFEWQPDAFDVGALAKFAYDPYLPIDSDSVWNFAASSLLATVDEPKLRRGLLSDSNRVVVRVLASPTFGNAVVVRAESNGHGGFRLTSARFPGAGQLDYSMHKRTRIFGAKVRDLPPTRTSELRRLLAESGAMRSRDLWCPEMKDGTVWTLEVLYGGRYNAFHVHEFRRPEEASVPAELIALCRFLFVEAGLDELPPHLFPAN